jgi:hypothetical protein
MISIVAFFVPLPSLDNNQQRLARTGIARTYVLNMANKEVGIEIITASDHLLSLCGGTRSFQRSFVVPFSSTNNIHIDLTYHSPFLTPLLPALTLTAGELKVS